MNHFLSMVLHKKTNFLTLHRFIRCIIYNLAPSNAYERLCKLGLSHLNHNYKVFIVLHLGLHVERDGPHTPCSHAKKLKNVIRG